jgi:hypothetical protein
LKSTMTEERAVAVLMANLKGSKKKSSSWIEIAQACRLLKEQWGFPKMASFFGVTVFMLRQIDKINELDADLQKTIVEKNLGVDAAYQLWRISEGKKKQFAKQAEDLTAHEVRRLADFVMNKPDISMKQAREMVEKNRKQKVNVLMIPLTEDTFERLQKLASQAHKNIHDFSLNVLEDYINVHK